MKNTSVGNLSPSQQQISDLLQYYKAGRLNDAEKLAIDITKEFPKYQFAWKILGVLLIANGRNSEALDANQKTVELSPQDAEAHYNLGITLQELGRLNEAEASYKQAIALKLDYAEAYSNLGVIFKELGRINEAEANFRQSIIIKPDFVEAHNNLGITLQELGRLEEAEGSYIQAIELKPNYAESYFNLGVTLQELGRLEEAEGSYIQAIELKPNYAESYFNLGVIYEKLGRLEEATQNFKQAIELKPEYSTAKHMLAALTGKTTSAAPLDYVENLFDNYAAKFESSLLDNLDYKIPRYIREMIIRESKSDLLGSIIDLGCGTGLFGLEIRQFCEYLEGVDLSKKMLEKAEKKNAYNKLIKQDIVTFLSNERLNFDYFVSIDVFIYIGDLSDVFRLIKSRNKKSGKLAFSTEDYDGDGFFLEKSGRYSHSKKYIEDLCEEFGYQLRYFEIQDIRKNKNDYIRGGLYLLDF